MTHIEVTSHQHGLHRVGKVEQTQQVARRAARTAHGLRGRFVCEAEFFDQALQALRFFQRVEVFALHVLNQRHGGCGLVRHVAHQHRHAIESSQFGRAEAPLARNDFVDRA